MKASRAKDWPATESLPVCAWPIFSFSFLSASRQSVVSSGCRNRWPFTLKSVHHHLPRRNTAIVSTSFCEPCAAALIENEPCPPLLGIWNRNIFAWSLQPPE
ncbi:MAG: hypothetical protein WAN97_14255 [Candidatus Acidiferrales bacterium]